MTPAQTRMLAEVQDSPTGYRRYNGRARRTIEALARAGLVTYEYELLLDAHGRASERFTVKPEN